MAQWLRALAALPEEPGSFPTPTWQFTNVYNSNPREIGTFLWPLGFAHAWCTDTQVSKINNRNKCLNTQTKPGVVVHTFKLSAWEAEADGSL